MWFLILVLLIGGVGAVLFGWVIQNSMDGRIRFGQLGDAAVTVSAFPDLVQTSIRRVTETPEERFRVPAERIDMADFRPVQMKTGVHVQGLRIRTDAFALKRAPGWRIVVGHFAIGDQIVPAVLVFSSQMKLIRAIEFRESIIPGRKPQSTLRYLLHSVAILKDGSMIAVFDSSNVLQRIDRCGRLMWSTTGAMFNHAIAPDESERVVWTIEGADEAATLTQISTATGDILRRIKLADIMAANPEIDILGILEWDLAVMVNYRNPRYGWASNRRHLADKDRSWLPDPIHINDVEELPLSLADRFPGFRAGDLLVSARALNLVFVMDPETLEVRWWHVGAWRRQHDPDWQQTGKISVYDNNFGREHSRIVSIDPSTRATRVEFQGRMHDFYSSIAGKHQITENGNLLVASPMQGRAFEFDASNRLVFDMLNTGTEVDDLNYWVTDVKWFPAEAFDFGKNLECSLQQDAPR